MPDLPPVDRPPDAADPPVKPRDEDLERAARVLVSRSYPTYDPAVEVPGGDSPESYAERVALLEKASQADLTPLTRPQSVTDPAALRGSIEQFIGMTQVPTGVMGPVNVSGTETGGSYFVPLATTEGALVASYNRGAKATRFGGGITAVCTFDAIQRAPTFRFVDLGEAGRFIRFVGSERPHLDEVVATVSRHARLVDLRINLEGNHVTVVCEYATGEASGQNMVTICTDAVCRYLLAKSPVAPTHFFVEGNYSGDKKATAVSYARGRGKRVTAECSLPSEVVRGVLKIEPDQLLQYWRTGLVNTAQTGTLGMTGHAANALAAIYLACGQDVACVAESYVGITRIEAGTQGGIYASVTLPNLLVGTVGGGTKLPTQAACLRLMGCIGPGSARKLAEICAAAVLCGELSISAALGAGHFARAHAKLGRS